MDFHKLVVCIMMEECTDHLSAAIGGDMIFLAENRDELLERIVNLQQQLCGGGTAESVSYFDTNIL